MKFAFKPNAKFRKEVEQDKIGLGMRMNKNEKIVGLHVRRTDKINEAPDSFHEIEAYMQPAEEYFRQVEIKENLPKGSIKRKVYLATDDKTVLHSAKAKYPQWDIKGFEAEANRKAGLEQIVRDVQILSECDHLVCGLSSNVSAGNWVIGV